MGAMGATDARTGGAADGADASLEPSVAAEYLRRNASAFGRVRQEDDLLMERADAAKISRKRASNTAETEIPTPAVVRPRPRPPNTRRRRRRRETPGGPGRRLRRRLRRRGDDADRARDLRAVPDR